MISSSNFFPKTLFDCSDDSQLPNKNLGPWLQKRKQYATVDHSPQPVTFIAKEQLRRVRNKSVRKEVVLPVIQSKLFEAAPSRSRKPQQFMLHRRTKTKKERNQLPIVSQSLDTKKTEEQKILGKINHGLSVHSKGSQMSNLNKNIDLRFNVLGIPTSSYYQ